MRVANVRGRLSLLTDGGAVDVAAASAGRFGPDPQSVWADRGRFADWAAGLGPQPAAAYAPEDLRPPVPRPGQIFAIGLNYWEHAEEAELELPDHPVTFTKFPGTGPVRAGCAAAAAGAAVLPRQVVPRVGPIGPAVVTVDELSDPDDLELVGRLSEIVTLRPGDLIFTGTPAGVGSFRRPPRYLRPGDVLESHVTGVGEMRHFPGRERPERPAVTPGSLTTSCPA